MLRFQSLLLTICLAVAVVVARVNPLLPDGAWSCGDLSTDVLKVKQASLSPWPPVRGSSVMVYMRGEVAEAITNGSTVGVLAEIKTGPAIYDPYAGIYSQTFDLCDEIMPRVNGSCPIDAGIQTVVFNINMPNSTVNTAAGLYVNIKGTLWLGVIAYDRTDHSLPCLPPPL